MKRGPLVERIGQIWIHHAMGLDDMFLVVGPPTKEEYHPVFNLITNEQEALYEKASDERWEADHNMERFL